jgi:peptide/nickel transport system ATP-binding protein
VFRRKVGTVKAVSDVSFSIRKGEAFGLVGESGCGKTTVGWLIVALQRATSGQLRIDGHEMQQLRGSELRRLRADVQLMFQDPYSSLNPRMRVGAIVREPLKAYRVGSPAEQRARVFELLDEVGLSRASVDRYPHEFSGGQRQRIGLARALALNPKLVVADEPVSALDVSIQAQILNLMKDLQARHQLTFILISHDLAVVRYMADTIGVMYLGKLVEWGPAHEVYEHPAHHYTRGLLDAVPEPDPSTARQKAANESIRGELPSAVNPPSGCRFRTRCPRAEDLCAAEEPPLVSFSPGHVAACHFPLETPVLYPTSPIGAVRAQ